MDDLLQQETERQRRLLEEARKAVEQEKVRMRQGGARRIEPTLDEAPAISAPRQESSAQAETARSVAAEVKASPETKFIIPLRRIPDMRSALIPLDEGADGAIWSKPFSLPRADMEPWQSFLRGYHASALFPEHVSAGSGLRVDAAVQALFELKGIDIKAILEPAVQINGPVEYVDDAPASAMSGSERSVHEDLLAGAVEKGRVMGDQLYDALLGEGYTNLVQAWEKVHGRKPSVSELHFMLTTGRVKPPVEIQPRQPEAVESLYPPKAPAPAPAPAAAAAAAADVVPRKQEAAPEPKEGFRQKRPVSPIIGKLKAKFAIPDRRRLLFHLSHLALVVVAVLVYCIVMQVFD